MADKPSLSRFEQAVAAQRHEAAFTELVAILDRLNKDGSQISGIDTGGAFTEGGDHEAHVHFATRLAAAYGALITSPDLQIAPRALEAIFIMHRWIDAAFTLSGFGTSAHLLQFLRRDEQGGLVLDPENLTKLLLFFSPSSNIGIDFNECARTDGIATLLALLGYLSARSCISANAVTLRERILEWLPGRWDDITLGALQLGFACECYMHCSYAFTPRKHLIKRDFIAQMRKALIAVGAADMAAPPPPREKPRIVVVCEHFHSNHSVYRTHSRAVRSLKDGFEVIGYGTLDQMDQPARDCFHEVRDYPAIDDLIARTKQTADDILALRPDIVFHLGVGMSSNTIALASLRLAPVQCVSYGHTATTMSPVIDYFILPDDFVGSDDVFSEKVLHFPPESIPYAAPPADQALSDPSAVARDDAGPLKIAVPASIMKINATFVSALAAAAARASRPVEFHFFPLGSMGLAYYQLRSEVLKILPGAVVHAQSSRPVYLERLAACEFFICPFPYGNMNSIVDAVAVGIPGVCLDGPEAHAHADVAIFRRLGLPEALATGTIDDYVAAIVRLIEDDEWRKACQDLAAGINLHETMYQGDEAKFCEEMLKLLPQTALPQTV